MTLARNEITMQIFLLNRFFVVTAREG